MMSRKREIEQLEREMREDMWPEDGRMIRIKTTPVTERMGIAGWEGYKQGAMDTHMWLFAPFNIVAGDFKVGLPTGVPWWYIEEL
jgi:hypothetical protein